MGSQTVKRIAADILGVGTNRIWQNPAERKKISEALTRDDVRNLIKEGLIVAKQEMGVSRLAAREKAIGKRAGRRRGHGSRRGTQKARIDFKALWIAKVRALRKLLKSLFAKGEITKPEFKILYMKVKGNAFKGKKNMLNYIKEGGLRKAAEEMQARQASQEGAEKKTKKKKKE